MNEIRSIYLCGLGAIGCSYAEALQKSRPGALKIVADESRMRRYQQDGVFVNGVRLDLDFAMPWDEEADLILVSVKQHDLEAAVELIAPYVGEQTIILSFLNGIESEEIIGRHAQIGMERLLYSFVVETDAVKAGNQVSFTKTGMVVFGEQHSSNGSQRVELVKRLWEDCGIRYRVPEDMQREMWWKFMMNVGANQVSAVLRCGYGGLSGDGHIREAVRMACREVLQIAKAKGVPLLDEDIEGYFAVFGRLDPEGKTSMLQDVMAHRRTEVELFAGTVRRIGRELGIETPVNDFLYQLIRSMEP